jgi:hypothetical protein
MEADIHLDLARRLLTLLIDVLARKPLKTWSTANVDLSVSLLRLVDQAVRHAADTSALVPLLDQILAALGRAGARTPLKVLVQGLRADVAGGESVPG